MVIVGSDVTNTGIVAEQNAIALYTVTMGPASTGALVDAVYANAYVGGTAPAGYANAVIQYLPRRMLLPPGATFATTGTVGFHAVKANDTEDGKSSLENALLIL
jgi:hypothetical protein